MTELTSKPDHGDELVTESRTASQYFQLFLDDIQMKMNAFLLGDRIVSTEYTVATLPDATTGNGTIFVTDEVGGPTPAYSDLTNWRRYSDGEIVS